MDKFFGITASGSDIKTEIIAGVTTFMTMAYILAVNPELLSKAGLSWEAVFTATALSAGIGTLAMALLGRLPFALAPGMGLNAFFAFTVCGAMGYSPSFALTAVFLEGLVFILLTALNVREAIVNCIPMNLKKAISVGIGLFIAVIGMREAGLIMGVQANLIKEVQTKTIQVEKDIYNRETGKKETKAVDLTLIDRELGAEHGVIPGLPNKLTKLPAGEGDGVIVLENEGLSKQIPCLRLGNFKDPTVIVCLIGLMIGAVLVTLRVKGALLIAIFAGTLIGIPLGVTHTADFSWVKKPSAPLFFEFDWGQIFSFDMVIVFFVFLFVDMFDTIGTLIGVTTKAGMLDSDGKVPRIRGALFADAIGTVFGAILGTSTVTTYVESAAGVEEGGKTGFTAIVVAVLFFLALFLSPVFRIVPAAATAPALILVGVFMMSPIKDINFTDFSEAFPVFLCFFMMPMTYSIADGIAFGMISYILVKVFTGKGKDIPLFTYGIGLFFVLNFVVKVLMGH